MRIAILTLVSTPYFRARFRAAAAQAGVTIDSVELSRLSADYEFAPVEDAEPFERNLLSDDPRQLTSGKIVTRLLQAHLESHPCDLLVLPGWIIPHAFAGLLHARKSGVPVILMSESTKEDFSRLPLREWVKRRAVSLASSALVGGAPHRAYLRQLGLPDDRIFEGYDAVDNDYFARESARWREVDGPHPPYFLASNRFIRKKNLFRLLSAYARYRTRDQGPETKDKGQETKDKGPETGDSSPWPLVLLGDGEDRAALLAHAAKLGLTLAERAPWEPPTKHEAPETKNEAPGTKHEEPGTKNSPEVYLPGFRQIDELPRFYAHAGAFVHASTTEQWGLVVNEAMACGLPVIVSERCGCAPDLVKAGENGWTIDPFDEEELTAKLHKLASLPEPERALLGDASRRLIAHWGPSKFAEGLHAAARKALASPVRKAGWIDHLLIRILASR